MNVNDYVWVRLTDEGWRIRMNEWQSWCGLRNWDLFREVAQVGQEWQRFQMWELMQIFGPHMYNGMDQVFDGGELCFEDPA